MADNFPNPMLPQKVLMTADTVGGVWTYSMELIRALAKFNIQVELATMGVPLSATQWKEVRSLPNCNIHQSTYKLEWMDDPWKDVDKAGEWLMEINAKLVPDLVHLNNYCHGNISWYTPTLMVCHSCVQSWWQSVKSEPAPATYESYAARVKKGLKAVDVVVAPSKVMMDIAEELYGPFIESKVIYNGRDSNGFKPASKKEQIFSMGRLWDEAKNISALVDIAPDLQWPVMIAGDNNMAGKSTHLDQKNTFYLGNIDQDKVQKVLSETAIYVMPARYEPFGLSVLEAALSGCALVLGDIPSLREIWGDAALYVNPDDKKAMMLKISGLIENESLRKEMSKKAYSRAAAYSVNKMADEYTTLYAQLLKHREAVV